MISSKKNIRKTITDYRILIKTYLYERTLSEKKQQYIIVQRSGFFSK